MYFYLPNMYYEYSNIVSYFYVVECVLSKECYNGGVLPTANFVGSWWLDVYQVALGPF